MKSKRKVLRVLSATVSTTAPLFVALSMNGCLPKSSGAPVIPSQSYADAVRNHFGISAKSSVVAGGAVGGTRTTGAIAQASKIESAPSVASAVTAAPVGQLKYAQDDSRASVRLVNEPVLPVEKKVDPASNKQDFTIGEIATVEHPLDQVEKVEPPSPMMLSRNMIRDYQGPLAIGEAGVSPSLFREGRGANDLWRDVRAWQPMDLITIVIDEQSRGSNSADTEVKQQSQLDVSLPNLFGIMQSIAESNPNIDPSALVQGASVLNFKGEGDTNREDQMRANISAMVVEVLPSGVLRIEGQKIVAVNSEEKIMVISGLVRQRDITSENVIQSSKIANMRIDYYGQGTVDDAQHGGWGTRLLRVLWPF